MVISVQYAPEFGLAEDGLDLVELALEVVRLIGTEGRSILSTSSHPTKITSHSIQTPI